MAPDSQSVLEIVGLARLIELQIRNAFEVAQIEGQEGEIVVQGGGGDEKIEVGETLAASPQVHPRLGEALHARGVDADAGQALQRLCCRFPAGEGLDDPVGVEEVHQGRSNGREPASRAS